MSGEYHELRETGSAEVGFNENGEVWVKHAGEKYHMQPDEAREFARLLSVSADAAEEEI